MYHRRSPLPFNTFYVIASLSRHPYSLAYEVLYVIAKHRFAVLWQSPGRVTLLCAVCAVRKGILVIALFLTK